jgi:hypothetical protein
LPTLSWSKIPFGRNGLAFTCNGGQSLTLEECQPFLEGENEMAQKALFIALGMIVGASPAVASQELTPAPAPPGTATTRYCLRVDPVIGSRLETVQCRTREDWASLEVDVDQEWAENGVRVIA